MNSRVDLLILEIDDFIKKGNLKRYFDDYQMNLFLENGFLLVIFQQKKYSFQLLEEDGQIYWKYNSLLCIDYSEEQGIPYLLEKIIVGEI